MLAQDFHVHGVELRSLFLAQLPQRLARLSSRGERLHREGWDINTLHLLAGDAAALAAACRELEATELADCLEALSATVGPLLDPPRVPDSSIAARIAALLGEIRDQRLPVAAQPSVSPGRRRRAGRVQDQGFPLLVTPPPNTGCASPLRWRARPCRSRRCRSSVARPDAPPPSAARLKLSHRRRARGICRARAASDAQDRLSPHPRRTARRRHRSLSRHARLRADHARQHR